ncbi:MAG: hypothetical protein Q9176_005373 [Flavoplaca citrina]
MATEQIQDLPTLMLIQGSFQIPQVYDLLRQGLIARGYTAVQPKLPSCSDTENADFPQRSLTDDAAAIHDDLSRLVNDEGKTVLVVMHSYGGLVGIEAITEDLVYNNRGAEKLYDDLPADEATLWESRLVAQSYRVQETKLTRAAWKHFPSTYLITEGDEAVPPQYQQAFAQQIGAAVERCSSGHSPQLSQPEMLVRKIDDVSRAAMAAIER